MENHWVGYCIFLVGLFLDAGTQTAEANRRKQRSLGGNSVLAGEGGPNPLPNLYVPPSHQSPQINRTAKENLALLC